MEFLLQKLSCPNTKGFYIALSLILFQIYLKLLIARIFCVKVYNSKTVCKTRLIKSSGLILTFIHIKYFKCIKLKDI